MSRVVAIHQPNFLPWLGWLDKLREADTMILLDDAQLPRSQDATQVTNRVRLRVGDAPWWATVPIVRSGTGPLPINRVRIVEGTPWREKLLRTVGQSYAHAPHRDAGLGLLAEALEASTVDLASFNEAGIRLLLRAIGLEESCLVRSSALGVSAQGTERLVALVRAAGGDTYLSGDGAGGYQEPERFAQAGLGLRLQRFEHPTYAQGSMPFLSGLSALDALMHVGPENVRALLGSEPTSGHG